jgi:hypothetical protein
VRRVQYTDAEPSRVGFMSQLLQYEVQLTEERMRRVDVERTADKERDARAKEVRKGGLTHWLG